MKLSDFADAISTCAAALPAMKAALEKRRTRMEIAVRGVIAGFGGAFLRDCALTSLVCGVNFAILSSQPYWTGVLCAVTILLALRSVNRERLLDQAWVRWTLILIDGGGSARLLCQAGRKCFAHGVTAGTAVVLVAFTASIGGDFLNTVTQRGRKQGAVRRRIVPYSIWFFFANMYYRLTSDGLDGPSLTTVFTAVGMLIAAITTAFVEDEPPSVKGIKRGAVFSYRIGLYLSRGRQFELMKAPAKGRRVLRLVHTVSGETAAFVAAL